MVDGIPNESPPGNIASGGFASLGNPMEHCIFGLGSLGRLPHTGRETCYYVLLSADAIRVASKWFDSGAWHSEGVHERLSQELIASVQ